MTSVLCTRQTFGLSTSFSPLEIMTYWYTYILRSKKDSLFYTGCTNDLRKRLRQHNVGYMVADALAQAEGIGGFRAKFSGDFASAGDWALLKPTTFMNVSGDSVQPCAAFLRVPADEIIIVHDELDIPFGEVRIKFGGGHAGHNGLRSLVGRLGTPDFCRVRVGIGRPAPTFVGDVASYVLSDFALEERRLLPDIVDRAVGCVRAIATMGVQAAMNQCNTLRP